MKKLVYIMHDIKTGGVEVALLSAVPLLNKSFNISIIVLGNIDESLTANLTSDEKRKFKSYNYKIWLYPFLIPILLKDILNLKPDIVVSSLWRGSLIASLIKIIKPNIRYFAFVHNTKFFHFFDSVFTKYAIKTADIVLTDSDASSIFVKDIRKSATTCVVSFLTVETPELPIPIKIEIDCPIRLISLARLSQVKNIPLAIEAINYLRVQGLDVELDIYGRDDGALPEIYSSIEKNGLNNFVQLKGQVLPQNRFDLFRKYHGFIQFSFNEGMAMSVVEAMQFGLVCFVTPVGEIPNYLQDMKSGVLLDFASTYDKKSLLNKMHLVLGNPELCESISYNANLTFKNRPAFASSLTNILLSNINY